MKAAVFQGPHKLTIEEVEIDRPKDHEVLVKIKASGVCHSDLHYYEGNMPAPNPCILGHEAAGIVEEVGPEVTALKPGDHVIQLPMIYCGHCPQCVSGFPTLCTNRGASRRRDDDKPRTSWRGKKITPTTDGGSFAEKVLSHENGFVKIPDDVPLDRAALVGCGVITGAGAVLRTAEVRAGSTVAVFGCGGIGLSAVQAARLAGARRIIAVDVLENKLAAARRLGATDTVDASSADPVQAIRNLTGGGADYAFEAIGSVETARQTFECTGLRGTAVIIGAIGGNQTLPISYGHLMGERKLMGSILGSTRFIIDAPNYIELYRQGRLNLDEMVTRHCRLDELLEAFELMKRGAVIRSVVMFD
jgi:S-(hydroxymethyl)glutathione dehydrogenase / alcohol dehydrogenase